LITLLKRECWVSEDGRHGGRGVENFQT